MWNAFFVVKNGRLLYDDTYINLALTKFVTCEKFATCERMTTVDLKQIKQIADEIKANINQVIVGKEDIIDQMMIALICSGHVLLENVPGTGKTLLVKALATSLHCDFKRVQFTPDLLPSDLSGVQFFNQQKSEFEFRPGPIFTNILLADEINRATPRTQSSLLECMEEGQAYCRRHK